MARNDSNDDLFREFSLVQGGPVHRLFCRCGLMRLPVELLGRRMAALVLVAWLPLFMLSIAAGELYDGVTVPFLRHLAVHARFLGSLPLLLIAEVLVHYRIAAIVRQFEAQGIVLPEARARFHDIVRSSQRMAHSAIPEVVLIVLSFTLGHWLWSKRIALPIDTWYGHHTKDGTSLTAAGYWYAFVSLPLLRFLLYRWYLRLAIWYRLIWKVSRLPLNLNPAHPDRAGGLGFLSDSVLALAPVLVAHTISMAGLIGDQIWHRGMALPHFKFVIGAAVLFLLLLVTVPLMFFIARLSSARRAAIRDHGILAARYVDDFDRKWIHAPDPKSPLGSEDIQSLADLGTSFDVVVQTTVVPIGKRAVLKLLFLMALPLLPLTLTMMPLDEIIARLAKILV